RRSEVLRSLRHHLRVQNQEHHTISGLEERGVERGSAQRSSLKREKMAIIIIIIINPLTARVIGAPQMILQFSPFFSVLRCPLGLAELQACPFPDVVFPPFPLSALSSSPFHCALQDGFGQT
ncbi:hypothetical protein, partial [Thiolapillus sp.]|uniref:hypothetical protein n=1 Tax=Thiolapillus sp. TaxID=2017437 RepID=UPI003AF5792B